MRQQMALPRRSRKPQADLTRMDMSYTTEAMALDAELHFNNSNTFRANYAEMTRVSDPVMRACRAAFLYARCTLHVMLAMIKGDMTLPFGFDLMRPFQEYEMSTVVAMKGGLDTGFTAWGHSNVVMSQNAMTKTMFMHLSYYSKAIIHAPEHIIKFNNVAYGGYRGGCGHEFFTMDQARKLSMAEWIKEPTERVENFPSMFAVLGPSHEVGATRRAVDFRGSYTGAFTNDPHHPSAHWSNIVLGLDTLRAVGKPGYMAYDGTRNTNSLLFQGRQEDWIPAKGNWGNMTRCRGHHGYNVQPGCKDPRNGKIVAMPDPALLTTH